MTTISRRIDKLGRVVLSIDIRKQMGLEASTEVKMIFDNGVLTIKSALGSCKICGVAMTDDHAMGICPKCIHQIKAM